MYLFGSKLIKKIYPDFREPNDSDWVTNDLSEYKSTKLLSAKRGNRENEIYYIPSTPDREMTADEIYTLKVSHAIYDIHWEKTMSDIRFLQLKGCKVIPELLKEFRDWWSVKHADKRCDFSVDEDSFFKDNELIFGFKSSDCELKYQESENELFSKKLKSFLLILITFLTFQLAAAFTWYVFISI